MSIAARIRAFREAAGVTQAELGRRLGVGQSAIQKWEAGTRELSVTDLERLADAIGLSPALFVAGQADAVVYAAKLNAVADMQDALASLSRRYASEASRQRGGVGESRALAVAERPPVDRSALPPDVSNALAAHEVAVTPPAADAPPKRDRKRRQG